MWSWRSAASSSSVTSAGAALLELELAVAGDVAQREHGGDRDTDLDGDDQVEGDGRSGGEDQHDRVGPGGGEHGSDVVGLDHAHGGDHEHAGERGERDLGDETAEEQHDQQEHDGVDDGGERGCGPRRGR